MTLRPKTVLLPALALVLAALYGLGVRAADEPKKDAKDPKAAGAPTKAALTVTVTQAQTTRLPMKISANGNIAAWQEASVGTEANGLRLAEVRANVGDVVKKGQVLAVFAGDTVQADLLQAKAAVAEAEAMLGEAAANAQRARELGPAGALSGQQINNYLTAERTAQARLEAARASYKVAQIRVSHAQVVAPDNGIISARSATVGAVLPAGQELFRLIRQGRLEWRAEVPSADLGRLKPGMVASVVATNTAAPVTGKVRMVAPTVDAQTRNGIVYVDLASAPEVKAGMYARGEFDIGQSEALTLPQGAVVLRDGFNYVLKVGPDSKVTQLKVGVGRRVGDRVEITRGLDPLAKVVAAGGGFLAEGDVVRVVEAPVAATPATPATAVKPVAAPKK
ncbi:efflux RND transporter periplasmic adaptor subunit [Piscinibacter gummiphilus]|uniref:Efflux RND transporter periplasmic adaptor subunit n=1 Tax=Piscinibacter gummiphilus TaxID=946333 RepID=A0ABZ0CZA8_9BURK|nr:efflux RND transporter periplasmic adaptor subunit [Piscinibacter gummiphilus]WOB08370.1 efflux RND transporter periplasmic adaptor subunit [Piscinibacter gummiphilus]